MVITGGTGSLGSATVRAVHDAADGWVIVITGRDRVRVGEAARSLQVATGAEVHGLPLDLARLWDVRRFAEAFPRLGLPPLHAIVCNAAVQFVSGTVTTADGMEATFAVNHLAHFLLVRELLPCLRAPGRIVLVASDTHDPRRPTGMPAPVYTNARQLAYPPESAENPALVGRRRYTTSKLCNILMAYELARRLPSARPPAITVNAFDPGLMPGTGLARDYRGFQALAWKYVLPVLTLAPGINAHTPSRSATALARLLTDPELAEVTGHYFSGTRDIRSSDDSYDRAKAADLWETGNDLINAALAARNHAH